MRDRRSPRRRLRYDVNRSMPSSSDPILLYDGICGLCNRLVQFVVRHDQADVFRLASLQSPLAAETLARHSTTAAALDTFYVVVGAGQPGQYLLARFQAVVFLLEKLGGPWKSLARLLRFVPRPLGDLLYHLIARNRYRMFGKFDACPLPDPRHRHKFLQV